MKNQYFGDINDYHKYALLRALTKDNNLNLLVAWMLTPNDSGRDGKKRVYKDTKNDPELYKFLMKIQRLTPKVSLIEKQSHLFPNTTFYSEILKDDCYNRLAWWKGLHQKAAKADLVFLDPDNGFEVDSVKIGRPKSSKYVYWTEIEALWKAGKSLLIYQHGKREKREVTAGKIRSKLSEFPGISFTKFFKSSNVLYTLAAQKRHKMSLNNSFPHWEF